jgi:hypothetical protein
MSLPFGPPIDYSRYSWRVSPEDPSSYIREPAGGEYVLDTWNRLRHGDSNLFTAVEISLTPPLSTDAFISAMRKAWVAVRYTTPIVALTTVVNNEDVTHMKYTLAKSAADATAWAERTVRLYDGKLTLDEARYELGQRTLPEEDGSQTFLYVLPRSDTSYGVLLHTHHTPFDGAGAKVLITRVLKKLAVYATSPETADKELAAMVWGEEAKNLLPVAREVLAESEPKSGPLYEQTLGSVMEAFAASMPVCPVLALCVRP